MAIRDRDILDLLPDDGRRVPARVLMEALGLEAGPFFRAVEILARAGLVRRDGTSYRLTWAGADRKHGGRKGVGA